VLVFVGIILLLLWLFEYAVHLTAGSLVDLLLIFAAISFGLDFLREREAAEPRPGWDHRPPKAHRRRIALATRWVRQRARSLRGPSQDRAARNRPQAARSQS
jgi:hypothetical protein